MQVVLDGRHQGRDVFEGPATDALARKLAEPAFHEVEPRTARRNEMHVDPGMSPQPALHRWTLMRAQIVGDHMNRLVARGRFLEAIEKPHEARAVALGSALAEDDAIAQAQAR